jgi:hypothetical protein
MARSDCSSGWWTVRSRRTSRSGTSRHAPMAPSAGPTSSSTDRATSTSARMESCCTPPEQSSTAERFAVVPQSAIALRIPVDSSPTLQRRRVEDRRAEDAETSRLSHCRRLRVIANVTGERQTPECPSVFMTGNPACDVALWPKAADRVFTTDCRFRDEADIDRFWRALDMLRMTHDVTSSPSIGAAKGLFDHLVGKQQE